MKPNDEAVSPVIGVILMVAITVVLAAIVFVLVTNLQPTVETAPDVAFAADGTDIMVVKAPTGMDWADLEVTGCDTVPTGTVEAGDKLEVCGESVQVRHVPTNSLVYSR